MTSFFLAPAALLSALAEAIGGSIAWDISTVKTLGDVFDPSAADIQVRGLGTDRIRLSLFSSAPEYPEYRSLDVGFTTAYGWNFFDGVTTTVATQAQIDDVLAHASSFIIRAEYWSGSLLILPTWTTFTSTAAASQSPTGSCCLGSCWHCLRLSAALKIAERSLAD